MIDFIDKTSEQNGTPINRSNMMAIQGFCANTVVWDFNTVTETNENGDTLVTTFEQDKITQVFTAGNKTITKTKTIEENGSYSEVLS